MKLLLCKNVHKLGIVGDVVDVSAGYARNYLLPQGLATEPNEGNIRRLAEARRQAEQERLREIEMLKTLAERIEGVEITIAARANEEGHLYGSVGRREIARALSDEGWPVESEHVVLDHPIRHLDTVPVELNLGVGLRPSIKVWVVREKTGAEGEDEAAGDSAVGSVAAGTEAGDSDKRTAE